MIGKELELNDRKYVLQNSLGRGGFGEVYLAVHQPTNDYVAVKVLPNDAGYYADKAIKNEIELSGRIKHPNIITVLGVNLDPNHPLGLHIVMDYASGGTLLKKLDDCRRNKQAIPIEYARQMMLQIAQGAKAINEHLIHRDIKPDNILLDGQNYRITDFGIAKIVDENTRYKTFKGIQHWKYKAPEGWLGQQNSHKMDIYSVGLIFYEILSLKHPLEEFVADPNNFLDWQTVHIERLCPDIQDLCKEVSPSWSHLLKRMLAKKAESRPEWEDIIKTIDGAEVLTSKAFSIDNLLSVATNAHLKKEADLAAQEQRNRENLQQEKLIRMAIDNITVLLDEVITEFNDKSSFGKFEIKNTSPQLGIRLYKASVGKSYIWNIFQKTGPLIVLPATNETIMSVGYLGPPPPPEPRIRLDITDIPYSANLFLVKRFDADIYGEWRFGSLIYNPTIKLKTIAINTGLWTFKHLVDQLILERNPSYQPRLSFRTDIQQAFVDLLHGSIQLATILPQ